MLAPTVGSIRGVLMGERDTRKPRLNWGRLGCGPDRLVGSVRSGIRRR